jgi:hypothetical protein
MYQYEISSLHFSTKFDLTVVILEIKGVKGANAQNFNLFFFFFLNPVFSTLSGACNVMLESRDKKICSG